MAENQNGYWQRAQRQRLARRTILRGGALAGVGAAGLALVGCGGDDAPAGTTTPSAGGSPAAGNTTVATPKRGGTYRWVGTTTSHLDIHQDSIAGAGAIMCAVYNRLLRFKDDAAVPEPDLAVSMPEQPDKQTLVFTIQEGAKFHDKAPVNGRALVAEDVVFSLNRARTNDPLFVHRGDLASIDKIEAVDKKTVRITTKYPNATLLSTLAGWQYILLAPETLGAFADIKTDKATIGTGPFVLDSFASASGAKMSRHPNFWRKDQPYFDALEQINVQDAWSQFLAGKIDATAVAAENQDGFDSVDAVLKKAGVNATVYQGMSVNSAQAHFMNNLAAPFNDIRVREGLNLILDRTPQMKYGFPIGGIPGLVLSYTQVKSGFGLPDKEISAMRGFRKDKRDQDIKDGLALLAQAGYTKDKPLKWEIMGWSTPQRTIGVDELQLAQAMYQEVSNGICQPAVKALEWGTWKQAEARHEFQMISSLYSMGFDAHDHLTKMYSSTGGRNFAQFKDPAFDDMLLKEAGEFDIEARKKLVQDMLRYVNDPSRIANAWTTTGPEFSAQAAKVQGRPALFDPGKIDRLFFA